MLLLGSAVALVIILGYILRSCQLKEICRPAESRHVVGTDKCIWR